MERDLPVATSDRPTSSDVARLAGVSRASVSYVVNGRSDQVSTETRDRILAAIDEIGYAPNAAARSLRAGRSGTVLLPMLAPTSSATDALTESLAAKLRQMGLSLLVHCDPSARGLAGARVWAEFRPDAIIVEASRCDDRAVQLLERAGTAVVTIGTSGQKGDVAFSDVAVAAEAARYLVERGHRRLACLIPTGALHGLGQRRFAAFADVARTKGVTAEPFECAYDADEMRTVVGGWRDGGVPDAVYGYNDDFAVILIQALNAHALRVPGDIAVIGSGDFQISRHFTPRITSTYTSHEEVAESLATAVQRTLAGEVFSIDPTPAHVAVRESA